MRAILLHLFAILALTINPSPSPDLVTLTRPSLNDNALFVNAKVSNSTTPFLTEGSIWCSTTHGSDLNKDSCENAQKKIPHYREHQVFKHRHYAPHPSEVYV